MCIPLVTELWVEGENKSPENTVSPVKPSAFHCFFTPFMNPENLETFMTSCTPLTCDRRVKKVRREFQYQNLGLVLYHDFLVAYFVRVIEVGNLEHLRFGLVSRFDHD